MSRARPSLAGGCALALLGGCSPQPDEAPAGSAPPPAAEPAVAAPPGRFHFVDVTAEAGLAGFRQENGSAEKPYITETVGGGVALTDLDGDGDLDAYLTNG